MFSLHDYANYCSPGAFAAVTGVSRQSAASVLCRWSVRCGSPATLHTWPVVLAVALVSYGHSIERWSPRRGEWRTENSDDFRRWVWSEAKKYTDRLDQIMEMIEDFQAWRHELPPQVEQELNASREVSRAREKRRRPGYFTVNEWLARFPVGLWVLHIPGHVMVARDGAVIAGDSRDCYGDETLQDVWRVIRPDAMKAREEAA